MPLQHGTKPPVTYRSFAFRARALPWGTAVARALFARNPFFTGQGELARCRVISGEPSRNKTDRRSLRARRSVRARHEEAPKPNVRDGGKERVPASFAERNMARLMKRQGEITGGAACGCCEWLGYR